MCVSFFPIMDYKEVNNDQLLYRPGMNHGEVSWSRTIRKLIKDIGQCTR